jgi:glycosyltransferase involved in cell wall biosynthesis
MALKHLKVLHINKFHHVVGGAEEIYFRTAEILEKKGNQSIFFSMRHPNNLPCETSEYFMPFIDVTSGFKVINYTIAAYRTLYSIKARRLISQLLDRYSVDVVHIHDMHRQMSPSILLEFQRRRIPTVMTLHNYKMICPSFLMMANNKLCEACNEREYINAMKTKCVKGSFPRSALIFVEAYFHHKILDIYKNIDIFIAPSLFMKRKHEEMGFKKEIIQLPYPLDIYNFEKSLSNVKSNKIGNKNTIIYFGRLEPEKGLFTLFDAIGILSRAQTGKQIKVKIIGEGSIKEELKVRVKREGLTGITFSGFLKGENLYREVMECMAVVLPSEWYENYPVSIMETLALGKPVIGARIGGIPEMVKDHETGLTFESGNSADLSEKIRQLLDNPARAAEMGRNARMFAEREFDIESHYAKLMEIYEKALSKST